MTPKRTALTGRPGDQLPGQTNLLSTINDVQRASDVDVKGLSPAEEQARKARQIATQRIARDRALARASGATSDRLADQREDRERRMATAARESAKRFRDARRAAAVARNRIKKLTKEDEA